MEERAVNKDNLCRKILEYEEKDLAKYFTLVKVGDFFEALGYLVENKFLDLKMVSEYFRDAILNYYGIYKLWVTECRQKGQKNYMSISKN